MKDDNCVEFLQWSLPRLRMRWPGFRKVRKQVCKRVGRRLQELNLPDVAAYRGYLETHPKEWNVLDAFCRITISRFYRDIGLFDALQREILPELATAAIERHQTELACWSAGCASGEEPYTLAVIWKLALQSRFPALSLSVVATDTDPQMLKRCHDAYYPCGSLRDFPQDWLPQAFEQQDHSLHLRDEFRRPVVFLQQDLRNEMPAGPFDLILCRNLAFTYFDESLQKDVLLRIVQNLQAGGRLVIGQHERLPFLPPQLAEVRPTLGIFVNREGSRAPKNS